MSRAEASRKRRAAFFTGGVSDIPEAKTSTYPLRGPLYGEHRVCCGRDYGSWRARAGRRTLGGKLGGRRNAPGTPAWSRTLVPGRNHRSFAGRRRAPHRTFLSACT